MRYSRVANVEAAPLQNETLLLHPDGQKFCLLNHTATFIWQALSAHLTAEELAAEVCRSFAGVGIEQAKADIDNTLEQLASLNLVVPEPLAA